MHSFRDKCVYLLADGRMFKVVDSSRYDSETGSGIVCVQFVDKDECSFVEANKLDIVAFDRGVSGMISFAAARSIHIRINRMSKV